jgi:hypothetical protein
MHYVISQIIVKIKNNSNFLKRRVVKVDVKKSNVNYLGTNLISRKNDERGGGRVVRVMVAQRNHFLCLTDDIGG